MTRVSTKDKTLMAKIDEYLENKSECSMGEIEEELGIKLWKQYWLYRAYHDYFPATELVASRWRWNLKALTKPRPGSSQDVLSATGD